MILILTVLVSLYVSLFFWILRKLNDKWREIVSYINAYLLLFVVPAACLYVSSVHSMLDRMQDCPECFSKQGITNGTVMITLFCISPAFIVSYLLYPFKIIKRNKILIWIVSILTVIVVGFSTLIEILHAFSDM